MLNDVDIHKKKLAKMQNLLNKCVIEPDSVNIDELPNLINAIDNVDKKHESLLAWARRFGLVEEPPKQTNSHETGMRM